MQFTDHYFYEVYRKSEVQKDSAAEIDVQMVHSQDGSAEDHRSACQEGHKPRSCNCSHHQRGKTARGYTKEDFLKIKAGTRNVPEEQEMNSGSEFSSIAGPIDLTDLDDLAELGSLQKKNKAG